MRTYWRIPERPCKSSYETAIAIAEFARTSTTRPARRYGYALCVNSAHVSNGNLSGRKFELSSDQQIYKRHTLSSKHLTASRTSVPPQITFRHHVHIPITVMMVSLYMDQKIEQVSPARVVASDPVTRTTQSLLLTELHLAAMFIHSPGELTYEAIFSTHRSCNMLNNGSIPEGLQSLLACSRSTRSSSINNFISNYSNMLLITYTKHSYQLNHARSTYANLKKNGDSTARLLNTNLESRTKCNDMIYRPFNLF
jgi:hypothetical protein